MKNAAENTKHFEHKRQNWRAILSFCARYWWMQRKLLALVIALLILMVCAEVCVPIFLGRLIDALTKLAQNPSQIRINAGYWAVGILTVVSALHFLFNNLATRVYQRVVAANMSKVLEDGFARVQLFSADWHANSFAGATVHKLIRGRWSYEIISEILIQQLLPLSLVIFGIAVVMLVRFPIVGLAFALMVMLYVAASLILATKYVRPANVLMTQSDTLIGGAVADAVSNNTAVKAYGAESRETDTIKTATKLWRGRALRAWGRAQNLALVQHVIWLLLQAIMMLLLIRLSQNGQASAGDVAFVITANLQLGGSLRKVGDHIRMLQRGSAELVDLIDFEEAPLGVEDDANAHDLAVGAGEIVFNNVCFSYHRNDDSGAAIYDNIDVSIAPGERVALVGPSGSGKTTFVKLIHRLYDVSGGTIWIDGQDISKVSQASLRRAISLVPQDPALFHRSLADNISYGCPEASGQAIIAAAKRAHAHDFIMRLPEAYATLVGERGLKLSGGERQRVAIARAFLADTPVVIFDEATSSLDTITEKQIQIAMEELMVGRTTIIIAHRLSTIRSADRILVFENGRIVEQGRHSALIARKNGTYAKLHEVQVELNAYV
ncbi:MAG: ATP-binding cassette subfamily B bacterial [Hyphomonadaceae bacterium]|nr:MAG: ATP-binding cassette subfamily B bacterial [Hyphomonadaceae bacterium]